MTNAAEPTRWEKLPFSDAPPVARTHARAVSLGAVEPTQDMRVLVVFRPQTPFSLPCQALSRAAYRQKHSTSDAVISRLRTHAETCGLTVERADPAAHLLILRGTCQHAVAAFRPEGLGLYRAGDREFIGREGGLSVPEGMAGDIVAVMGFDHRPVARPHYRRAASPNAASTSYTPPQVAARYGFTSEPGTGQTIGLIELGGGYDATQMADYFHQLGVDRTGRLASVSVGGAGNVPGDPNGADGEVQLDIEVAGSVAPGADLAVYFASNQGSGFYEAVSTAIPIRRMRPMSFPSVGVARRAAGRRRT